MLKGTEAGRWVSLPVRQKQPLAVKGTGGIGGLIVPMIDIGGLVRCCGKGFLIAAFPNFPCYRMIAAAVLKFEDAGLCFKGDRNGKVVFAGGIGLNILQFFFQVFNTRQS